MAAPTRAPSRLRGVLALAFALSLALALALLPAPARAAAPNVANKERNVAPGSKGLVAEWTWEAWPVSNSSGRGPGPRAGAALWLDHAAGCWWLFGGRQINPPGPRTKAYSDLWRFEPAARLWTRVLSTEGRRSGPKGMLLLRSSLQESDAAEQEAAAAAAALAEAEGRAAATPTASGASSRRKAVVESTPALLCGRADPQDPSKRSLAYYDPRNRRSNTVWQLELSDRVWTAYMCCCDRADVAAAHAQAQAQAQAGTPLEHAGRLHTHAQATRRPAALRHGVVRTHLDAQQDEREAVEEREEEEGAEEEEEEEEGERGGRQERAADADAAAAAKMPEALARILSPASTTPTPMVRSSATSPTPPVTSATPVRAAPASARTPSPRPSPPTATAPAPTHGADALASRGSTSAEQERPSSAPSAASAPPALRKANPNKPGLRPVAKASENKSRTAAKAGCCGGGGGEDKGDTEGDVAAQAAEAARRAAAELAARDIGLGEYEAFCPSFDAGGGGGGGGGGQPVAWCDTERDELLAFDLRGAPLALWRFDLASSHWSRHHVHVRNDSLWPGCSTAAGSVRYAGTGAGALVLCAPYGAPPSTGTRLVYRVHAAADGVGGDAPGGGAVVRALGQLELNGALAEAALWADDARAALAAAPISAQRTLLFIAHDKLVNLWLLDESGPTPRVEALENVWPGNALKWFREYSSPLYNLQVEDQTWLLPNPRALPTPWPTERGRFVVRLRQRDDAARLLLGAARAAARDASSAQAHGAPGGPAAAPAPAAAAHDGLKAMLFFAFSLTIFAVFGVVLFVRRCVTCPGGRRGGVAVGGGAGGGAASWCGSKSDDAGKPAPPVIRYSVIPDDLAYPKA